MNAITICWSYLKSRPLSTFLNAMLLGFGIAVIIALILIGTQLKNTVGNNTRGIDLVVGAKGSPLQLILCSIFHVDFPTGNIKVAEAEFIARNRFVKKVIPLALGDSYQNFRIVGTDTAYASLFQAKVQEGTDMKDALEVVLGAEVAKRTGMKPGATFESAHGFSEGHSHALKYKVVGVYGTTHSVLDNLIITSVQSIWMMHEEAEAEESHDVEEDHDGHGAHEVHEAHKVEVLNPSKILPGLDRADTLREITSLLVFYRSPMAVMSLPRAVNGGTNMQAASPAFESARLFSILGTGIEVLNGLAYVLIFISALSIFLALYNSLKERKFDVAILRTYGASRRKVGWLLILEGMVMTLMGGLFGIVTAHGFVGGLVWFNEAIARSGLTPFVFYAEEGYVLIGSLVLGIVCSLIPGLQVYRTDISRVLAGTD